MKASEPQLLHFDNLLSVAFISDEEDPVALFSSNLFCKYAFVVIESGYQPSQLPEAPFFWGKKASERKLTVFNYAQYQLLPFNFVATQLLCQIEISGILHKAANVRIEDDVMALVLVVSVIVWTIRIRQQHESHLRLEKKCHKRQKHLMKSFKCYPQRQQCEPHGLDEHRDPEIKAICRN